jgi:hypothetical protein
MLYEETVGSSTLELLTRDDSIRKAGFTDLAAMKLNAISGNGTRIKDFIDIAFLSGKLSLNQMLRGYEKNTTATL